jgi:hypothetical protein
MEILVCLAIPVVGFFGLVMWLLFSWFNEEIEYQKRRDAWYASLTESEKMAYEEDMRAKRALMWFLWHD